MAMVQPQNYEAIRELVGTSKSILYPDGSERWKVKKLLLKKRLVRFLTK